MEASGQQHSKMLEHEQTGLTFEDIKPHLPDVKAFYPKCELHCACCGVYHDPYIVECGDVQRWLVKVGPKYKPLAEGPTIYQMFIHQPEKIPVPSNLEKLFEYFGDAIDVQIEKMPRPRWYWIPEKNEPVFFTSLTQQCIQHHLHQEAKKRRVNALGFGP